MVYLDKNATYALNSYVWKLLEANLGWEKSSYKGATPIIPTAQQPELMETGNTFLVYGSAVHPAEHLYALRRESVSYVIYGPSSTEVNKVINLLVDTFERQDEAAADVNDWLDAEAEGRGYARNISFGTIREVLTERAEPADEEGGYVAGTIMLELKYTVNNQTVVTSGFTYEA